MESNKMAKHDKDHIVNIFLLSILSGCLFELVYLVFLIFTDKYSLTENEFQSVLASVSIKNAFYVLIIGFVIPWLVYFIIRCVVKPRKFIGKKFYKK